MKNMKVNLLEAFKILRGLCMEKMIVEKENTLAVQCFESMQNAIVEGAFIPGQKLKVEELKRKFGVGQSPIREALSRLVDSGLVEALDNKGFRVTEISEADIRDIYQTFFEIEMLALTRSMQFGDDVWQAKVVAALHHLGLIENKLEPVPYSVWVERNYAFHLALIEGCRSPLLLKIRADVYRRFDRYCRISFNVSNTDLQVNHMEHKKLAEAVLKRDVKLTEKLMKHHLFGSLESVIKVLKKNKLL